MAFEIIGDGEHMDVVEFTYEPGRDGPDPHIHHHHSDGFRVLEGELAVRSGGDTLALRAGDYGYVPPGTAHTFWNGGDAPVRFLNIMAPGGFEQYLKEAAALPGPPDADAMGAIASRYDFHAAG